ncbi:hypothetical protein BTO10_09745 [Vibrio chagasii]|uniref:Uncharacterized protein n=1 Tax=Vibrio chagasii TaxID=170679 RepID=A0A2S7VC74_9VIBR|nr:hypothetical protein BTO10_09745 [Vibrio chagasii]
MHIINTPLNPLFDSKAPFYLVWIISGAVCKSLMANHQGEEKIQRTMLVPTVLQIISIFIIQ